MDGSWNACERYGHFHLYRLWKLRAYLQKEGLENTALR